MNYSTHTLKARKRQQGLTLLELTVVLLVLIGLSGLILPYAQGYLQRTHDSTGDDNLWELNNAINLFQSKYLSYPKGFHTLIENDGSVYDDLMNTSLVAPWTVNMQGAMSLTMGSGIDEVWEMKDGANNQSATFDAVSAPISISNGTTVLGVVSTADIDGNGSYGDAGETTAHHLAYAFYNNTSMYNVFDADDGTLDGTDNCNKYVVFGVGPENEMINKVISDAPLHFARSGGMGPEQKYNRFVAVFKVDSSNAAPCSTSTDPAKLVGSAMLMGPGHLWGLAYSHGSTWNNVANKNN